MNYSIAKVVAQDGECDFVTFSDGEIAITQHEDDVYDRFEDRDNSLELEAERQESMLGGSRVEVLGEIFIKEFPVTYPESNLQELLDLRV